MCSRKQTQRAQGGVGEAMEANVSSGGIAPGDTVWWADVPTPLAKVVAYDAGGDVVDEHPIKPCDDPVDCEVR
ncbi:MAG: hypothetical protein ACRDPJ_17935 [Nocardioidaceae bacterium]